MKSLVIAEKPSVGRDIARVLNCKKNGNGCLEGEQYVVTWALGHLVELSPPESYGDQWKDWKMETLPMLPENLEISVIKKTGRQFAAVKAQMLRKDIKDIIIATDAGREGELVARWIIKKAGVRKPIRRLWISSVTDKAIREGFAHLKNGHDYDNLYAAAVARAEADWLVGLNASRALTVKHNAQLSCGRVQTPTLSMILARSQQIKNFKPQKYYGLKAMSGKLTWVWREKKSGQNRMFDKVGMEKIKNSLEGKNGCIIQITKKAKKTYAPALYDLTQLQQEANKRYGFTAKETLNYMQSLYERHKVLTYPRTDSRYLTTDIVDTLAERVKACRGGQFSQVCAQILKQPIKGSKSFVDNSKVSDHHAIIPTEQGVRLSDLEYGERKIYEMVVSRFLAVLMPPFEYEQTDLTAQIGNETFVARGKVIKNQGWKAVYEADEEEENPDSDVKEQILPEFHQGQEIQITALSMTEGETKPPVPFTEATLLGAMENPAKYMESHDASLAKTLGETGGLGTVATRADIIDKLFNSFMIEKKGNYIYLTSKGRQVLDLAPKGLTSPELTARWEQKLAKIADGQFAKKDFESQIRQYTVEIVNEIKTSASTYHHDNITGKKCPQCGKLLLEVNHKNGRMLVCQDRECGYRRSLSKVTNARCPVCHKKMELVGEGENRKFVCACGYREKLSTFQERKKESGSGVSKRDVANYMKRQRQENEKPMNSALADALKNIKL
ncbi:DNA topoisomerase-3 [Catenibacillus scindens]|uniref:DNA topoisomerase 3 n=1 Tax=Catenibacillus scindens TaxID=673271 RepID=A0A7W8M6B5_9FIRM|nr:DNA topoisomerase III [Catenibacillus scindens]MBB5265211.1 DNA topoisomerase-3 [Catenibacillus scindens]